jgi:hypothetical protein
VSTIFAGPRKLPESTWAELRTAHASGIGLRELARNAGIPAGTVLARAKREGWTKRIESARTLARQAPPVDVGQAAAASMAERGQRHLQRVAGIVERTLPAVEAMEPERVLDAVESFDRLDKIGRRTFGLDERGGGAVRINILAGDPYAVRVVEDAAAPA